MDSSFPMKFKSKNKRLELHNSEVLILSSLILTLFFEKFRDGNIVFILFIIAFFLSTIAFVKIKSENGAQNVEIQNDKHDTQSGGN